MAAGGPLHVGHLAREPWMPADFVPNPPELDGVPDMSMLIYLEVSAAGVRAARGGRRRD
jgi:hypothetical protein